MTRGETEGTIIGALRRHRPSNLAALVVSTATMLVSKARMLASRSAGSRLMSTITTPPPTSSPMRFIIHEGRIVEMLDKPPHRTEQQPAPSTVNRFFSEENPDDEMCGPRPKIVKRPFFLEADDDRMCY